MAKTYSPNPSGLKTYAIDNETHSFIGRIIRAFAEIDDLVSLYICNLAEVSETRATILLGQLPISSKLEKAFYLARTTGQKITALHQTLFDEAFTELLVARNALAHGVFMGATEDDHLAFLTTKTLPPSDQAALMEVACYNKPKLAEYAANSEALIPKLTESLKLQSLRETRYHKGLLGHPKGQPQQPKAAKPKPPPQS